MGLHPVLTLWRRVLRQLALLWWEWAAREIPPLHPDVHIVVHRVNDLRRAP